MNTSRIGYATNQHRARTSKRRRLGRMQELNKSIHFRESRWTVCGDLSRTKPEWQFCSRTTVRHSITCNQGSVLICCKKSKTLSLEKTLLVV